MRLAEVWTIVAREFLANVKTLRFTVCLILAIVLGVLVSYIATDDYERALKEYSAASALSKDQIRGIRVWMDLKPTVHKRPEPLSIFSQGISNRVERSATVRLDRMPELLSVGQRGNPFLSIFPSLDMLIVVKVVLGLLAILLSFDAVAGEREKGTLSLTLFNPVSRALLLMGKSLGAMSSLAIAAAVGFLTALIVFIASPMVSLSWGEWGRIGLIFLCTLLYLGQFYFLGLIVSCRTRSAGTALGITVLCWAVLMVIVPNLAVHMATKLQAVKDGSEIVNGWPLRLGALQDIPDEVGWALLGRQRLKSIQNLCGLHPSFVAVGAPPEVILYSPLFGFWKIVNDKRF